MTAAGRSYLQNFEIVRCIIIIHAALIRKSMTKFTVAHETNSVFIRLLIVKITSGTNLRTSHVQLSGKWCEYGEEDFENKITSLKEQIIGKKSQGTLHISILLACRLSVHRKSDYNYLTGQSPWYQRKYLNI